MHRQRVALTEDKSYTGVDFDPTPRCLHVTEIGMKKFEKKSKNMY